MFNLLPKDTVFFDLFEELGRHVVQAAEYLHQLTSEFPSSDGTIKLIRNEEHLADDVAHKALDRLDRTFITPFDREDIHTLIKGLDDIVDEIDALTKRFKLYHVEAMDADFRKQTEVLLAATKVVNSTLLLLRKNRKLADLSASLIEIHRLENVGDENNHAVVSRLFSGQVPALDVMRWKELFDRVERAIDKCEDVANTVERIVIKHG